jgi:hypothetical protein
LTREQCNLYQGIPTERKGFFLAPGAVPITGGMAQGCVETSAIPDTECGAA